MFELIFLGTSASAPSARRGLSAQVIKHDEHRFLLDCGEGTQRQILRSGIGFRGLTRILITHGHLDHILGLAGLFSTFTRWETVEQVEILGGAWALERIHALLYDVRVIPKKFTAVQVKFTEVQPGTIIQEEDFNITAFPVTHRGPDCFGYIFEERARRPFLVEKAEALGVPAGPKRRDLVNGKTIILDDGRKVAPSEVLGAETPGTKLAHTGDLGRTDNVLDWVHGADALVTEATYIDDEAQMARDFHHLTARQAAEMARDAEVSKLILTHISRRYRERDVREEAQNVFPHSVVARDFDVFQVKRRDVRKVEA